MRVDSRLSYTTSRSETKGLQHVLVIAIEAGVVSEPPFRDKGVGKSKVRGGVIGSVMVTTDFSLVGTLAGMYGTITMRNKDFVVNVPPPARNGHQYSLHPPGQGAKDWSQRVDISEATLQ